MCIVALIRYFHTAAGYQVRSTWLPAISAGNYLSCTGLTLANDTNYCPSATSTIMGHLVQKRQGVRSTNPKLPATSSPGQKLPQVRSNEMHIQVTPISKLYSDDTGCLPVHAHSGNQYIMISLPLRRQLDTCRAICFKKGHASPLGILQDNTTAN